MHSWNDYREEKEERILGKSYWDRSGSSSWQEKAIVIAVSVIVIALLIVSLVVLL